MSKDAVMEKLTTPTDSNAATMAEPTQSEHAQTCKMSPRNTYSILYISYLEQKPSNKVDMVDQLLFRLKIFCSKF